jgi:hypothetical protein
MSRNRRRHSIPAPWFVRTFAAFLLALDIGIMAFVVLNYESLGWSAYLLFFGSAASSYFPIMALKTGDSEWVMLDMIFPG